MSPLSWHSFFESPTRDFHPLEGFNVKHSQESDGERDCLGMGDLSTRILGNIMTGQIQKEHGVIPLQGFLMGNCVRHTVARVHSNVREAPQHDNDQ